MMPSCNTYRLTSVSLTLGVGYLFTAAPAKRSQCSLPWTRGISSLLPFLTFNVGLPRQTIQYHSNPRNTWDFQGKPFSITVIQVHAPTSNTEEAEVEWFYEDLQDLLELTPKKRRRRRCPFHYRGLECKSRKSRNTWCDRQIWPWSRK